MIRTVLFLTPEPPYPLHSGGAMRTASLLHYFTRFAEVDLIQISEAGHAALLPPRPDGTGLVRSQYVVPLPVHRRDNRARYVRNAKRAVLGIPPLVDRLAGLGPAIRQAIGDKKYDIGIVEHFWCAQYIDAVAAACRTTVLDLHNVESVLHARCAEISQGLVRLGHARFASAYRKMEAALLPRFDQVLAVSDSDRQIAQRIAPTARISVYPNSVPCLGLCPKLDATATRTPLIVFSGNFEYHPNIDAVRFLVSDVWPEIRRRVPGARLRLVGRGERFVHHLIPSGAAIETSGYVADAMAEIASADIVIAPLRAGSGTRVKILEAWAAARPVVATPLAAEGLRLEEGKNIVLAPTAREFAESVARLAARPEERAWLGMAGRRTFEAHYTWQAAWRTLEANPQLSTIE
jgi:glycosyltransferase involved in cell wall biosynthesis